MAMVDADWTITRSSGNIRYIGNDHGGGSPTYATVIEFHRWLQDFADDEAFSGDDELDITDSTPSDRSTDNIITLINSFNIDAMAAEHLFDGSIIQTNGDVIYDGIINFGNPAVQIQIIQNGAVLSDDWWNFAGAGLNADAGQGVSHRFMILTRTGAADIDGRRLIGTSRTYGNDYSEFSINGTSRGNNVLALSDTTDLNNATAEGTVATYTGIVNNNEGYIGLDVNNDTVDEFYYSEWDTNQPTRSINDFYERLKYLTRDGTAETLYGLSGELFRGVTHQIAISGGAGTWVEPESLSWTGGTGQLLAVDNTTSSSATTLWIQLLTGVIPAAQTITGNGAATATSGTVTARAISTPFVGASTGSAIIGAYGLGIEVADLSAIDKVFDLTDTLITPPNNVTFTVFGLVSGEDRVLVTTNDGGDIDFNHYTLNGSLTGGAVTSVVVNGSIDSDTPSSGTIRLTRVDGLISLHAFSAFSGSTFTIASTNFGSNAAANGANVFTSYIDKLAAATSESFTVVYNADRTLFVRVRDGDSTPIKTFETTGVLGTAGGSATAIRTSDD